MNDSRKILDSIRRLVRHLRVADRAAQAAAGLSAAQLFVLSELAKTPELSLGDLADRTLTDQSSVSVVVSRLVDAGLIARRRHGDDARRLVLTLTRAGRRALDGSPRAAQETIIEVLDGLRPADRKRFAEVFDVILERLGAGAEAPMFFEEESKPRRRAARAKKEAGDARSR